ncbi:hypothetical protein ACFL6O_05435 [candidate division KSB1 bacterium]
MRLKLLILILLISAFWLFTCGEDHSITPSIIVQPQSSRKWISGIPFYNDAGVLLQHDNRILESGNFLTFSDASSDSVKIAYSKMAEESLAEIMKAFGIENSVELGISDRDTKITIFSNRYLDHGQRAFSFGYILYALDSPVHLARPEYIRERYRNVVKHETYHVFDKLYGLGSNYGVDRPSFWFKEGMAEFISGGGSKPFETTDELDLWISIMQNSAHPIDVVKGEEWMTLDNRGSYYTIFHLAVRYLMDEEGLGKTYQDVRLMYDDILINHDFNLAFKKYMGISVEYFRDNFFDLVRELLSDDSD